MKLVLALAVLLSTAYVLPTGSVSAAGREPDPYLLEVDFALTNLEGDTIRLSDERYRGKVVLLDLFGTWCGPCHRQAPQLVKWYEQYRDQGFEIVGIAYERSSPEQARERLAEYVDKYGLPYEVLYGGRTSDARKLIPKLSHLLGRFPTTIFVERSGALEGIEFGYNPKLDEDMEMSIERLLAHPQPIFPEDTAKDGTAGSAGSAADAGSREPSD